MAYVPYAGQLEWQTGDPKKILRPEHPHNERLSLLSEKGLLGLGMLVWLLALLPPPAFRALRHATGKRYVCVAGLSAGFLAATIHSFFFCVFHEPSSAAVLWAMLALLEALSREPGRPALNASNAAVRARPSAWIRWGLAGLAGAYALARKFPDAEATYQHIFRMDKKYAAAHNTGGNMLREQGKPAEALEEFRQALALTSTQCDPLDNMGRAYAVLGNLPESLEHLRKAVGLAPTAAPAWYLPAGVEASRGSPEEAFKVLDRAITLKSGCRATAEHDPNFVRLRSDPRFNQILSRAAQPATAPRVNIP